MNTACINNTSEAMSDFAIDQPRKLLIVRENTDKRYFLGKRLIDFIFIISFLVPIGPVLLLIAAAIKLDSRGPIFFKQERAGKNGCTFVMYKFRTMFTDCKIKKEDLLKYNCTHYPDFKMKNDPRVTRVGKLLRKFSLDELPNFINILKGEMTIVGPRPSSFTIDHYEEWQKQRFLVLPGLTGLSQISGRGLIKFDKKVYLDIEYIRNQSLWLDVKIMFMTVKIVALGIGAY